MTSMAPIMKVPCTAISLKKAGFRPQIAPLRVTKLQQLEARGNASIRVGHWGKDISSTGIGVDCGRESTNGAGIAFGCGDVSANGADTGVGCGDKGANSAGIGVGSRFCIAKLVLRPQCRNLRHSLNSQCFRPPTLAGKALTAIKKIAQDKRNSKKPNDNSALFTQKVTAMLKFAQPTSDNQSTRE